MPKPIRTERTFGVTSQITNSQRADLARLRFDGGYEALLDIMEQACIEQESRLISTPVTEPNHVIDLHMKVQAMWQMFTHLQIRVDREIRLLNESTLPDPFDQFTPEERERMELLNPTHHNPAS